jgi:hypothetical protein
MRKRKCPVCGRPVGRGNISWCTRCENNFYRAGFPKHVVNTIPTPVASDLIDTMCACAIWGAKRARVTERRRQATQASELVSRTKSAKEHLEQMLDVEIAETITAKPRRATK